MRFPITVIMESAVFSVILKDDILLISKCILVGSGAHIRDFAMTESAFLFSRASESSLASKWEKADFVGAPQYF